MTREKCKEVLQALWRYKDCGYSENEIRESLDIAIKALEQEPYEKFESTKDHIYKLAGDYKCWDNRLTEDEAVELCHILEQEPCEDIMTIHTQGLDEEIRCTMCTNSMKSDRGCDGGCMIDKDMYKKVMDIIRNRIVSSTTPWIPFKTRPLTKEEKEEYPECDDILDCKLPDDGQRILVSVSVRGHESVQYDEFYMDDGCYLDSGYEIGTEAVAWMPLPEPYGEERSEE